jgi:hypothetical protein
MAKVKPDRSEVVHREVLTEHISDLLRLAREMGEDIQRERRKSGVAYRVDWTPPNIENLLSEDLRIALEDEVVPASLETESATGISERETQREVIKKALIGLKLATLRDIARERRLPAGGSIEDVATQIGAAYLWDEQAVARLVLDNSSEPVEVHGHSSHLYGLESAITFGSTEERLRHLVGRYIRTAIARWFIFEKMTFEDQQIVVEGRLRSYRAHVDEIGESPTLSADATEASAHIVLSADSSILEVRTSSPTSAQAAMDALELALDIKPLGFVPQPAYDTNTAVDRSTRSFSRVSLLMLDVLFNRLPAMGYGRPDLTIARFKIPDVGKVDAIVESENRPVLRAVRFDGNHLLDSAPTCRLLTDGRDLVEVSMLLASKRRSDGEAWTFPVRISIDKDRVHLATGYGTSNVVGLSRDLHREMLATLVDEMTDGILNIDRLAELCNRIQERAESTGIVAEADILD